MYKNDTDAGLCFEWTLRQGDWLALTSPTKLLEHAVTLHSNQIAGMKAR
jgi:hypothetical protein